MDVMSYFKNMLTGGESLFKNEDALDLEWVPKVLPFREGQQQVIVESIKPLLTRHNGKNVFMFGDPGVGKTAATRWVLRDLEENTDEVYAVYVNCWQKNTTYKIFVEICTQLGYAFTQNKNTEEIFNVIKTMVNKRSCVFVFDEIDKIEEFDFLYSILNDVYKKSIILITNYKEWIATLEDRVRSRLVPEMLEFKKYDEREIVEILKQRSEFAFIPQAFTVEHLGILARAASDIGDIRSGIFMLRECALAAENKGLKSVTEEIVSATVEKVKLQGMKKDADLDDESRAILEVVQEHSTKRIGDLFSLYAEKGGSATYKTFQRKIARLEKGKFITMSKIIGGKEGSTTIVSYGKGKTLDDF